MRPKGARVPGPLPLRPPVPQSAPGPPVPTVSFDQPPPLMSINTAPSPVSSHQTFDTTHLVGNRTVPLLFLTAAKQPTRSSVALCFAAAPARKDVYRTRARTASVRCEGQTAGSRGKK